MYRVLRSDLVTIGQGKIGSRTFADALTPINPPPVPQFLMSGGPGQESANAGLLPTAMLSSIFGQTMPDALKRLKAEARKSPR